MRRPHGAGHLYVKSGAYYVRWRAADGRHRNRRVGKVRVPGEADGLTRAQAERAARGLIEAESLRPPPPNAVSSAATAWPRSGSRSILDMSQP
jgi:hypothetical protein